MRARIYSPARNPMQSGSAKTGAWVLEFQKDASTKIDPLMGWTGSAGTANQVKMTFDSKEDAIAYATSKGIEFELSEAMRRMRKPNIRRAGYAENFSVNRRSPWTH